MTILLFLLLLRIYLMLFKINLQCQHQTREDKNSISIHIANQCKCIQHCLLGTHRQEKKEGQAPSIFKTQSSHIKSQNLCTVHLELCEFCSDLIASVVFTGWNCEVPPVLSCSDCPDCSWREILVWPVASSCLASVPPLMPPNQRMTKIHQLKKQSRFISFIAIDLLEEIWNFVEPLKRELRMKVCP